MEDEVLSSAAQTPPPHGSSSSLQSITVVAPQVLDHWCCQVVARRSVKQWWLKTIEVAQAMAGALAARPLS